MSKPRTKYRAGYLRRVLVCGGRNYTDRQRVFSVMDGVRKKYPRMMVVHGACRGADMLGKEWADKRGVLEEAHPANWDKYGDSAGPRRNQEMVESKVDVAIVFGGGKGTADMLRRLKMAGAVILRISE